MVFDTYVNSVDLLCHLFVFIGCPKCFDPDTKCTKLGFLNLNNLVKVVSEQLF